MTQEKKTAGDFSSEFDNPSYGRQNPSSAADLDATEAEAADLESAAEAASEGEDLLEEAERLVEEAAGAMEDAEDDPLAKAQAQVTEWQDKYLRLHAEWDTYRRRTQEQRQEEKARATEKLVEDIIPVLDDFERTIDYAKENGEAGLLGGVQAVYAKLVTVLEKGGVTVIDPKGEPFDALQAQAVATVPDTENFDETVADVYQKGYRMGKKVLRPAMVTITTGGPARPKDDSPEDEQ